MKVNEKIDILKFYAEVDHVRWNQFLTTCYNRNDVQKLMTFRNAFQQGMADLQKKGLESEKLSIFFIRIQRSIDNTMKLIFRDKNPNPLYDPLNKEENERLLREKRKKQAELEEIIRRHNY